MGLWAIYILSFTFLFSAKAWNIEHIGQKSENKRHFTSFLIGIHPAGEAPISDFSSVCSAQAGESANYFIHTANICRIPISQALQGESHTLVFFIGSPEVLNTSCANQLGAELSQGFSNFMCRGIDSVDPGWGLRLPRSKEAT